MSDRKRKGSKQCTSEIYSQLFGKEEPAGNTARAIGTEVLSI